jgi:hypothetical protein
VSHTYAREVYRSSATAPSDRPWPGADRVGVADVAVSTAPGCPDIADTESINPSTGASDGGTAGDLVSGVRYRGFLAVTDCIRGVESWRERDHVRVGRATVSPNVLVVSTRAADAYEHVRSPAGVIPALRIEGQLRPPMMSTSAMAPVIQLDLSDSRNDGAFVMPSPSPYGRTRMIVFPLIRSVGLKAATASSRGATLPMFVRSCRR